MSELVDLDSRWMMRRGRDDEHGAANNIEVARFSYGDRFPFS